MSKNDSLHRFILGHFLKFKWNILIHILSIVLYSAFLTYSPHLLSQIENINLVTRDFSVLHRIGYGILLVAVSFRAYHYVIWMDMLPKLKRNVYIAGFEALLSHKYKYYLEQTSGQLTKYCGDLASAVFQLYLCIFDELFVSVALIISSTVSLMLLPTKYMILVSSWCILFAIIASLFSKTLYRKNIDVAENEAKLNGVVNDVAHNILLVQLFNGHSHEKEYFEELAEKNRKAEKSLEWLYYLIFTFYNIGFIGIAFLSAYWFSVDYVLGTVKTSDMLCFYNILFILSSRLWQVATSMQKLNAQLGKLQNAYKIFNNVYDYSIATNEQNVKNVNNANNIHIQPKVSIDDALHQALHATAPRETNAIEFQNVSFGHNGHEHLFNQLNISIREGEKVGIIGHSGGGKTTFTNLILDLYDQYTGSILIEGLNIHDISKKDLYTKVSVISQQSLLFNRSIYDNISYGKRNATMEEIIHAAKLAQAHDFIMATEHGYNTIIVENGASLSGGQKQRLAIARTILMNTSVVIFDEFTSQLDLANEHLICNEIMTALKDRTLLIVAHRFSTIKNVDRILVFDKGAIAADGTHAELQATSDIYRKLKQLGQLED